VNEILDLDPLVEQVRSILSIELQVEPGRVVPDANLRSDLGMDSVAALNVLFAAEETFGFEQIDPTELADIRTVADIERLVRVHLDRASI
jgi:acyl carrier protein